jgi:hypothetical protein
MKFLQVIYFHVYNAYYKDGNFKNDIPHLTAFGIVSCSLGLMIVGIANLIKYSLTQHKLSAQEYLWLMLPSLLLFYFLFLHKGKYSDIYKSLKGSDWDKSAIKILIWAIIFMGFASFAALAFAFKNVR